MILDNHVAYVDLGSTGSMTEVEYQLHLRKVLTCYVALPEYDILTSLEVHVGYVDDSIGICLVGELNSHTVDILISIEDNREVVVGSSLQIQVGVEVELILPAV